jgi:hypothetical protein
MSHHCHCSIVGIFLGFITGALWLLFALLGFINDFFELIGLGGVLGNILNILIALIGFLAFLFFGLCLFKKAWKSCK